MHADDRFECPCSGEAVHKIFTAIRNEAPSASIHISCASMICCKNAVQTQTHSGEGGAAA